MRSNRINYIAVGAFVILVVAGLVVAVTLLSGRTGATTSYFTVYDNVAGVKFGTQVRFEGYPVGQVERVVPRTEGEAITFKVEMAVDQDFPLPADSRAAITSSSLLGGVSIEISGGDGGEALAPGARIPAGRSDDVMAAVSNLAGEINTLSREGVGPLLQKLNATAEIINKVIAETLPRVAGDLETASGALAETTPRVSSNLGEVSRTLNRELLGEESLTRLRNTLANLEQAAAGLNEGLLNAENRERFATTLANLQSFSGEFVGLAKELRQTRARVDTLMRTMDDILAENRKPVNQSVQDLRYTLGAVARRVDAITYNLESTSRNMQEFARQIRQNPSLLLRGGGAPAAEQ